MQYIYFDITHKCRELSLGPFIFYWHLTEYNKIEQNYLKMVQLSYSVFFHSYKKQSYRLRSKYWTICNLHKSTFRTLFPTSTIQRNGWRKKYLMAEIYILHIRKFSYDPGTITSPKRAIRYTFERKRITFAVIRTRQLHKEEQNRTRLYNALERT